MNSSTPVQQLTADDIHLLRPPTGSIDNARNEEDVKWARRECKVVRRTTLNKISEGDLRLWTHVTTESAQPPSPKQNLPRHLTGSK